MLKRKARVKIISAGSASDVEININFVLEKLNSHYHSVNLGQLCFHEWKSSENGTNLDLSTYSCNLIFYFDDEYTNEQINQFMLDTNKISGWNFEG